MRKLEEVRFIPMRKSSVKYKILYSKTAKKDIKKLDIVVKKKIGEKILQYSKAPFKYDVKKLSSSDIGDYRWRMGKMRIVFDISGKTITILRIKYRKDSYK